MLSNPQQTRKITCPLNHWLVRVDDLCELYRGQSYVQGTYVCDTCRGGFHSKSHPSTHCITCKFDLCPNCYEAQKNVQIECPQNHPLLKVSALQKFSNYSSNRYRCNVCRNTLDSSTNCSAHCRTCKYDLCPNCLANQQAQAQMNFQPSYQQQQEPFKKSGNPSIPFRQITCTNQHILTPVNNLAQLHPNSGGVYASNTFACDTCRRKYTCSVSTVSHHCSTCKFDMCSSCFEGQKAIKTSCPKSHPLFLVSAIKAFANYNSNNYRCNSCRSSFDAAQNPTAHCKSCQYDLCPTCLSKSQAYIPNNDETEQMKNDGNLKQVTCPARHTLSPVNNLPLLHPSSNGGYKSNVYVCDTCRQNFKCQVDNSYHCQTCKFDICPSCYHKDQKVNFDCSAGHPLYIVSNLKGFNAKTNSYVRNVYICNNCRGSFDAAFNPSCHCRLCQFDLCANCFEAKENQVNQQKQYQTQQQQNNYQNQFSNQQYQIPQFNNQQYNQMPQNDIQYQVQQNFANLSIQEPIKQSAPNQYSEEAKYDQPLLEKKHISEEMLCIVCLSTQRSHLFAPCMHLCACGPCSTDLISRQKGCPMCRTPIQSSVKVYMS